MATLYVAPGAIVAGRVFPFAENDCSLTFKLETTTGAMPRF